MSLLRDLIPGYENMTEEELENAVMTGRVTMNAAAPKKASKPRKPKQDNLPEININDYE